MLTYSSIKTFLVNKQRKIGKQKFITSRHKHYDSCSGSEGNKLQQQTTVVSKVSLTTTLEWIFKCDCSRIGCLRNFMRFLIKQLDENIFRTMRSSNQTVLLPNSYRFFAKHLTIFLQNAAQSEVGYVITSN